LDSNTPLSGKVLHVTVCIHRHTVTCQNVAFKVGRSITIDRPVKNKVDLCAWCL